MEVAYAAAGVTRFAAWVHESDRAMRGELERRGYTLDTTTRAMGMVLDDLRLPRPDIELATPDWWEYLRIVGVPPNFLRGADPGAYHILVARLDGANVATAMAFDHRNDCGIYNVGTLEHARRRGLGTALTAYLLHDALARGRRTASLQSTAMAERVYAAVGFRDLGRILEYLPQLQRRGRNHPTRIQVSTERETPRRSRALHPRRPRERARARGAVKPGRLTRMTDVELHLRGADALLASRDAGRHP